MLTAFERTYNAFVLEGYGLSEGTCANSFNPLDGRPRKVGSVGVPLPDQEIRIVDDGGAELPMGQVGEIVIGGPSLMQGYYRNPEATAAGLSAGVRGHSPMCIKLSLPAGGSGAWPPRNSAFRRGLRGRRPLTFMRMGRRP